VRQSHEEGDYVKKRDPISLVKPEVKARDQGSSKPKIDLTRKGPPPKPIDLTKKPK
jgi:hypothetical protein